ncbi:Aspartyl/Asparaginyl beta-hydroxylase [Yersinia aldovae ATCC 35236]|nr:Aspartyl/Asparaginyl beta-hydroxylase [Yersinia aldovae ATCC 35236]
MTLCPYTTELLRGLPSVKAAMFAELPDGSRLPRHRDPYAGSLRYHLGLITPNDDRCFIDVDGTPYSWRDGDGVLFDETYIHYAENQSGQDRLILFCDIERPMRYRWAQGVNHWLGRNLMSAATAPNEEGDRTGGVNRAFKYIYAVRKVGKRLKAWNRRIYYLIKWLLFGGIAAVIFYAL